MRTENRDTLPVDEDGEIVGDDHAFFDWKDTVGASLEALDDLLNPYDLEIVNYDGGADDYLVRVERRKST